jgi:hypothetical protein
MTNKAWTTGEVVKGAEVGLVRPALDAVRV